MHPKNTQVHYIYRPLQTLLMQMVQALPASEKRPEANECNA